MEPDKTPVTCTKRKYPAEKVAANWAHPSGYRHLVDQVRCNKLSNWTWRLVYQSDVDEDQHIYVA
ncbi:MAG: hypothetical protein GX087_04100 [Desulfobulbaceae bacterium]|nr:hypothetical protein [Desulfobulbaceae bacterium]